MSQCVNLQTTSLPNGERSAESECPACTCRRVRDCLNRAPAKSSRLHSDSIYTEVEAGQNGSAVLEARVGLPSGGSSGWERVTGGFWGDNDVLCLLLLPRCSDPLSPVLKDSCMFLCLCHTSIKVQGCPQNSKNTESKGVFIPDGEEMPRVERPRKGKRPRIFLLPPEPPR